MYQYNVYSLDWKYLGCFWSGGAYFPYVSIGDYRKMVYDGPLLTADGKELDSIKPLEVYLKLMSKG